MAAGGSCWLGREAPQDAGCPLFPPAVLSKPYCSGQGMQGSYVLGRGQRRRCRVEQALKLVL